MYKLYILYFAISCMLYYHRPTCHCICHFRSGLSATAIKEYCIVLCTGILYYFSSTANPILYNLMSRKFRAAFRRTVCCWFRCESRAASNPRPLHPLAAPAHGVHDGHHPRVPPRRPPNALIQADNPEAVDPSANDGLLPRSQVELRQRLFFGRRFFF